MRALRRSRRRGGLVVLLVMAGAVAAPRTVAAQSADTVWLVNSAIRLGFAADDGALLDLTDLGTDESFVRRRDAAGGVWQLDLMGEGDAPAGAIVPAMARRFSWRRLEGTQPGLALVWTDF